MKGKRCLLRTVEKSGEGKREFDALEKGIPREV